MYYNEQSIFSLILRLRIAQNSSEKSKKKYKNSFNKLKLTKTFPLWMTKYKDLFKYVIVK